MQIGFPSVIDDDPGGKATFPMQGIDSLCQRFFSISQKRKIAPHHAVVDSPIDADGFLLNSVFVFFLALQCNKRGVKVVSTQTVFASVGGAGDFFVVRRIVQVVQIQTADRLSAGAGSVLVHRQRRTDAGRQNKIFFVTQQILDFVSQQLSPSLQIKVDLLYHM